MTAFIYDAVRTPFGKFGKALAEVRPDDLLASTIQQLLKRHPGLDPARIDEVVAGNANGAGEENRNVARMAWLLAGGPVSVPGVTVNRLCGSGVEAAIQASRAVETGDVDLVLAGGVESMTRAPWVQLKPSKPYPAGPVTMESTALGWRFVNPQMPKQYTVALGEGAEILADKHSISREEQDEFAVRSHRNATEAWNAGRYDAEIVRPADADLTRDETIRGDSSMESLARLKPAFRREGGTVTAGNASSLNDGASAMLIGTEAMADTLGDPMARILSRGVAGVSPEVFGIGPVESANRALERAGLAWDDIDLVELNEAFAAQSIACLREWPGLDPEKVNVDGGAIAIGHPLGASGGRIIGHLAHSLKQRGLRYGMASICIGVGLGLSMVIEAV